MKLKRHRKDLNDLKLMQDNHVQAIAKRYQHLISWAEAVMDESEWVNVATMERRERIVLKEGRNEQRTLEASPAQC